MYKLFHYPLCPFSRSIRLALGECGLIVELEEERPWAWRRDFLELNPAGSLPVLIGRDTPPICGAYAIAEYLAETEDSGGSAAHGQLLPRDAFERAETRRIADWFHRKFDEEVSRIMLEEKVYQRFADLGRSTPDPALIRASRENLRYHLSYVSFLTDQRHWLAGDKLSFADLAAAGHLSVLDYLAEVPWEEFPHAKQWYALVKSRPSFRPVLEDRVAGLAPPPIYTDLDF